MIETNTEISTAWPLSGPPGAVEIVGIASARTAGTRMIAIVRRRGIEHLAPVLQAAQQEREAQYKQAVAEDRADQRGLGQDDETVAQGEDRDEQLGQVAQRRLEHARRPGAEGPPRLSVPSPTSPASPASVAAATTKTSTSTRRRTAGRRSARSPRREADHHQRRATEHGGDPGRRLGGLVGHRPTLARRPRPVTAISP